MTARDCIAARERLGWSPYRLAAMAGLSERTVLRFEAGEAAPRPGTLIALRRAFRGAMVEAA
jgi:transcriptional regulator with XRE-family HTH domain